MKKTIAVMAGACILGSGLSAWAVELPWQNSFEDSTTGISITNSGYGFGDWFASSVDVSAVVTNLGAYTMQSPMVNYPISGAHTKVVAFKDGSITNVLNGAPWANQNATVDLMLQPVRMEQPTMTAAISNSQMSVFVDTNGYLNIWHSKLATAQLNSGVPQWTTLTDFGPIATDKWIRLTVTLDYTDSLSGGLGGLAVFQIRANGHLFTNANAYSSLDPATTGGSWFICASSSSLQINQVAFSGSGMFDDLVITNNFDPNSIQTEALATPYGTPQSWLAQYTNANPNLSITNDSTDVDGDGMQEWQEYVAGTSPADSSSVLKLLDQQRNGNTNVIHWLGSASALGNYQVEARTNLSSGSWAPLGTVVKIAGTNTYSEAVPTQTLRFYRVSIPSY